jgi:hypothetical protein
MPYDTLGRPTTDIHGRAIGYDGYGQPYYLQAASPYGEVQPGAAQLPQTPGPDARAMLRMPNLADLGGKTPGVPPWYRQAYFPTAPFYSTDPNVGYQTRFYSQSLVPTNQQYVTGSEALLRVQFDLPCRLIAINGAAFNTGAGNALPVGVSPRDCFLFRLSYTTGDRLMISERIASTVVGTSERPGELGGTGYSIDQGASVELGITPLLDNLRIDITLVCLELRGKKNFTDGTPA